MNQNQQSDSAKLLYPDTDPIWALGGKLGHGGSRDVYNAKNNANAVIKKMKRKPPMANFMEWQVWNAVKAMARNEEELLLGEIRNQELAKIFAECIAISESGNLLLMERLITNVTAEELTKLKPQLPIWLTDTAKITNFGRTSNGQIKCLDYGQIHLAIALNPKNNKTGIEKT